MSDSRRLKQRVMAGNPGTGWLISTSRFPGLDLVACAGLGAVMGLGHAPVSFPLGVLLALPVLGWMFLRAQGSRQAFIIGLLAGTGYFGATMFWIVEPFLVQPESHGWMAPFALVLTATGMSLFWAIPFCLARQIFSDETFAVPALAALWSLAEFSRSILFTGFPWGLIGYVWSELPLFQLVSVTGPFGLGFVTYLACLVPAMHELPRLVRIGFPASVLALAMFFGWVRLEGAEESRADNEVRVRVVQPNAEQHLKWKPGMAEVFFERMLRFTAERPEGTGSPDVVVWPETAFAFARDRNPLVLETIAEAAGREAMAIAGVQRREEGRVFNSVVFIDGSGQLVDVYDKHHLVPFGEYVPLAGLLGIGGLEGIAGGGSKGFSAGPGPRVVKLPELPSVLPLICYEAVFPADVRAKGDRPGWLLHVTNDAWFGEISGPYQHLVQARARAIEQGLPLVRAANTGISAVVDAYGRVASSIPLGKAAYLDYDLPAPIAPTLYVRSGEWPWMFIAFLTLVAARVAGTAAGPPRAPGQPRKEDMYPDDAN